MVRNYNVDNYGNIQRPNPDIGLLISRMLTSNYSNILKVSQIKNRARGIIEVGVEIPRVQNPPIELVKAYMTEYLMMMGYYPNYVELEVYNEGMAVSNKYTRDGETIYQCQKEYV